MRKLNLKNNIFLKSRKSFKYENKVDYYLILSGGVEKYLFTRNYSSTCHELCKSGIPINNILYLKKDNEAIMRLVKYLNYIMPYFIEYYELNINYSENRNCA